MAWTCQVCTFQNSNEGELQCEICETPKGSSSPPTAHARADPVSRSPGKSTGAPKSTVQATLFGGIAKPIGQIEKTEPRKANKENVASKQTVLDLARKISSKENTRDLPFSELKIRAKKVLQETFQIEKLRFLQPKAVVCGLKRQSQIVVMATGGGKSLCYQLPAIVLGGTSIVISPLIALMQDQVKALVDKGVEAAVISSGSGEKHNLDVMERLLGRTLRQRKKINEPLKPVTILYVTPEQVQTNRFREILKELDERKKLTMFAVDEAHCLSSWGHDFRKSYMRLDYLRETYPDVPLMACTATATPKVLQDIIKALRLEKCPCHIGSFDRPNIFYKVKYKDSLDALSPGGALGDLVKFITKQHKRCDGQSEACSGIVYVHTRQDTAEISRVIREKTGIKAVAYHGGMKVDERNNAQQAWTSGEALIAVATVAFGMGIDLAHVRYVVHWTLSKNIESFYQESGRAGRDGLPSFSLLYYSKDDASKYSYLLRNKNSKNGGEPSARDMDGLQQMVDYCTVVGCRRYRLLKHFGERMTEPKNVCGGSCDFCHNPERVRREIESSSCAKDFSFHTKIMQPKMSRNKYNPSDFDMDGFENNNYDADYSVNGLGITKASDEAVFDSMDVKPTANFVKASSILSKYETIECKGKSGFVSFKERINQDSSETENRDDRIRIPQHLIAKVSSKPIRNAPVKPAKPEKTSSDLAVEAARLREELEKAKAAAEARRVELKSIASTGKRRAPPPPPPSVSFSSKRRR